MNEKELQVKCEKYLKDNNISYMHIPQRMQAKNRTNALKGWPDFTINLIWPAYVELKNPSIKKTAIDQLSPGQHNFMEMCIRKGYLYLCTKSYDDFVKFVERWKK